MDVTINTTKTIEKQMDKIILEEVEKMIQLAIDKGLIPKNYKEIDFNVLGDGQAVSVEIWKTSERRGSDRTVVEIPGVMQSEFIFSEAAKHLKKFTI